MKANTFKDKIMERMICDIKPFPPWVDFSFAVEMLLKLSEVAGLRLQIQKREQETLAFTI
jgi:hypothetical protein